MLIALYTIALNSEGKTREMTTYPSSASQRDGYNDDSMSFFPPLSSTGGEKTDDDRGEKWQITPPIITGGRVALVRSTGPLSSSQSQSGRETPLRVNPAPPGPGLSYQDSNEQQPAQNATSQEEKPLFRVSFFGPDQQWYRFSANRVEQDGTGALAPQTQTPPLARAVSATPQPALHPAWYDLFSHAEQAPDYPAHQPASHPAQSASKAEDRDFILQIVQPALTGLMDGSVSTLAPIFAVAFATHLPFTVFLVGMASALGAGISMAFAEALSDDGDLTGRGKPLMRGLVTGLMTFLSGAGHTLPFLIPQVQIALYVTYVVVTIELFAIAAIRARFFGTSWWLSLVQVVGGGVLVMVTSLLLGSA
jgi:VIT1/CCC1 family predicted Fe2+/Mn2+ transporter